ncbi:MAG: hypothetical protein PVG88_02950 [Methyloceanibacter sp.]
MTHIVTTVMLCILVFFSLSTLAEDDRATQLDQHLEQVNTRLSLTDEQFELMVPVLQNSMEAQQSILSYYGIDLKSHRSPVQKLGVSKALAMKQELDAIRADTLKAAEDILTEEQFDEFKSLQNERQAQMRRHFRGRR